MPIVENLSNLHTLSLPDEKFNSNLNCSSRRMYDFLELTIILKMFVNRVNSTVRVPVDRSDPNSSTIQLGNWPDSEFNNFKTSIKTAAENFWNNKFWFLNLTNCVNERESALSYLPFTETNMIRPNIKCKFRIDFVNSSSLAQKAINAVYIVPYSPMILNSTTVRSDSLNYDSEDIHSAVFSIPDQSGVTHNVNHDTIIHEIGHAIGLPHVGVLRRDAPCLAAVNTNQAVCYGIGRSADMINDVMGYGQTVHEYHSLPWKIAFINHVRCRATDFVVRLASLDRYERIRVN